jgi:hypothetical protein
MDFFRDFFIKTLDDSPTGIRMMMVRKSKNPCGKPGLEEKSQQDIFIMFVQL